MIELPEDAKIMVAVDGRGHTLWLWREPSGDGWSHGVHIFVADQSAFVASFAKQATLLAVDADDPFQSGCEIRRLARHDQDVLEIEVAAGMQTARDDVRHWRGHGGRRDGMRGDSDLQFVQVPVKR